MTVRRVMGTEVEYGVSLPGVPTANPILLSAQIVNAYAAGDVARRHPRWDFEEESPLRDARGFDLSPAFAMDHNGMDLEDDPGLANVILTNGARLYVDHAHPEYSAPEVTNPMDSVLWDKAGERVMEEAARRAETVPGQPRIGLYKNNTDNKGASYGSHENYLVRRSTPFADLVTHLTPFFVSRQVVTGAGRVGLGQDGRKDGFQISQRADFFEVEVGLETTLKRPIINTRDEPHADPQKYRRLHVIIGDANLSETSNYLKVGTTALVLSMIESGAMSADLGVDDPVRTLHAVSHDPSLKHLVRLRNGQRLTAVEMQRLYFEQATAYTRDDLDDATKELLAIWGSVLDKLETDPMLLADELDWVAKLRLLQAYRERDNLGWASHRLQLVDLQYADIRRDKGLYYRLVHRGAMKRLLSDEDIDRAVGSPPVDTRAYFRGECVRRYGEEVAAASWDSVIFDVGTAQLVRVPTLEPERGTREHVGALLDASESAAALVDAITSRRG